MSIFTENGGESCKLGSGRVTVTSGRLYDRITQHELKPGQELRLEGGKMDGCQKQSRSGGERRRGRKRGGDTERERKRAMERERKESGRERKREGGRGRRKLSRRRGRRVQERERERKRERER